MSSLVVKSLIAASLASVMAVTAPGTAASQTRTAIASGASSQLINLPRGSSMGVELPSDARDIIVSNPQVADAVLHSSRRITLIGLAPGETDALFLDATGRAILTLRIRVDAGTHALHDTLSRTVPGADIRAEAVNDSIILTGVVASPAEAQRAAQVAAAFVSAPEKVVNMIAVTGSDQVTLKVRVVEVQRSALKQLGVSTDILRNNGIHTYGFGRASSFGVNGIQGGAGNLCYGQNGARTVNMAASNSWTENTTTTTPQPGGATTLSNVLTGVASTAYNLVRGTNANACLEAFERVGLVRTLAEPHLTSVNGEASSFLAGGEFPVPASRDRDGQITVEYKPYGVALAFRPVVMSEGRINLQIKVEVSDLTSNGGITIGAGTPQSVTLPGLSVRRSENTVEIPSGGAMMIAGLLQESTRQSVESLPGMTNLPVLGSLFRSRDYLMGETELVVIVEPYIVSPTSPDQLQTPADGLQIADDASALFFGQLNQAYGTPAATVTDGSAWQGTVGYVIE
ncbi:type II and III secretion system protein family protein [Brevundimonas vesicularis]|uniref:type II and III secretion system protein family protein n=1 Tax=Brevundimonas vesicularis TaxID=41276 RepID=UPI0038D4E744